MPEIKAQKKIRTKADLHKVYESLTTLEVRYAINEIIAENRNIEIEKVRNCRKLRPVEVDRFQEIFKENY